MIVDSLTSTQVFVEKKIKITITCNNTKNSNGVIEIDDLENKLISIIDSGDTNLYRLSSYKGTDYVLLYNEDTRKLRMVQEGDMINIPIDFTKGTKYYVGAKRVYCSNPSNYIFNCDLRDTRIFKVFLDNGRELTSFRSDEDSIEITGNDKSYINDLSEIIVYTYVSNSTRTTLMSNVDYSFQIEYYGYDGIYDEDMFFEGTYFETMIGEEITTFESMEVSQTTIKDSVRRNFANVSSSIINAVENSLEMNTFMAEGLVDLPQYVGRDEFRIIAINNSFGRIVLINNCMLKDGVSLIYEKEKNLKRYTISCGNYIDINLSNPSYYGRGRYGRGAYGIGTEIYNSARVGGRK